VGDGDLVTGRTGAQAAQFTRAIIERLAARERVPEPAGAGRAS
jgi:hypothetical protein